MKTHVDQILHKKPRAKCKEMLAPIQETQIPLVHPSPEVTDCETRISQSHEHEAHSLLEMMTALQAGKRVCGVVQRAGPALGKTVCDHDVGEGTVIRVHHDEND